jgi:hypothetical protein
MPRGAKIAAQQTVIVSDRRSREPNDLYQAKPYHYRASCHLLDAIVKELLITHGPEALPKYS